MSGHRYRRLCSARRVAGVALIVTVSQLLVACSGGPQIPPQAAVETRTVKTDPFDGLPESDRNLASSRPKPAAPAAPPAPAVTETQMGMAFYPGATPYSEPGAGPDTFMAVNGTTTLLLQTHDPADRVVAFYKDKLTGPDATGKSAPPSRRDSSRDGKPTVTLSQADGSTLKAVEIRQLDNVTIIELMRLEIPASGKAVLPGNTPGRADGSPLGGADGGSASKTGDQAPDDGFISRPPASAGKPDTGSKTPPRSLQYP